MTHINNDVILYDPADIDSTVTAALLQSNGMGHAQTYLSDHTQYNSIISLVEGEADEEFTIPKGISFKQLILFNRDDPMMVNHATEGSLQSTYLTDSYFDEDDWLKTTDVQPYARLFTRFMQKDPLLPVSKTAALWELHDRARKSIEDCVPFFLHLQETEESTKFYMDFIVRLKDLLNEKLYCRPVDITSKLLAFLPVRPKYASMGIINVDLAYTPWITKLASLSMDGIIVYQYDRYGKQTHAGFTFNEVGERAYQRLTQLGGVTCFP